MPFVTIRVTGGSEAPTAEQKAELIRGVTDLLVRVLGKNPATTHVIIEEVAMDNWGIGGESCTVRRARAAAAGKA
ncbi:MAG: 4-oxalocrotonate tautomerase family protein [Duodenibacillus sp.]|nr:4-oxalocrotonate tautomerase family protein [Duodenibacillus sp.]